MNVHMSYFTNLMKLFGQIESGKQNCTNSYKLCRCGVNKKNFLNGTLLNQSFIFEFK